MAPGDWLRAQAVSAPERLAFIDNRQNGKGYPYWDYRSLDKIVDDMVERLVEAGVQVGDRVGMLLPPIPAAVFLIHALARLGAILTPLNLRLSPREIAYQLKEAGCAFLVCGSPSLALIGGLVGSLGISADHGQILSLVEAEPEGELFIFRMAIPHAQSVEMGELFGTQYQSWDLRRIQAIIFTSGTTGQPKGALLSFGNHFWNAIASSYRLGIELDDRWLLTLPISHVGGLAIILRSCLYGTAFVLQERFEPQAILEAITEHQISMLSLVPTMLHRLLEIRGSTSILAGLRCILLGGAAAPQPLVEGALAAGLNLALTYGMTETASQVATTPPAEVRQKYTQGKPLGSVGKPLLFCQVKILDENCQELSYGQVGQIAVEGPLVMPGYIPSTSAVEPMNASRKSIAEEDYLRVEQRFTPSGALLTGDMGYMDEQGDLWVLQRRSDLIVSGGENIYPSEVERVLRQYPGVADACVIGVDDFEWGQKVVAAIVLRDGVVLAQDELILFCRSYLAGYKIPRQIFFLEALPQTVSGKVQRAQVIELVKTMQNQPASALEG